MLQRYVSFMKYKYCSEIIGVPEYPSLYGIEWKGDFEKWISEGETRSGRGLL